MELVLGVEAVINTLILAASLGVLWLGGDELALIGLIVATQACLSAGQPGAAGAQPAAGAAAAARTGHLAAAAAPATALLSASRWAMCCSSGWTFCCSASWPGPRWWAFTARRTTWCAWRSSWSRASGGALPDAEPAAPRRRRTMRGWQALDCALACSLCCPRRRSALAWRRSDAADLWRDYGFGGGLPISIWTIAALSARGVRDHPADDRASIARQRCGSVRVHLASDRVAAAAAHAAAGRGGAALAVLTAGGAGRRLGLFLLWRARLAAAGIGWLVLAASAAGGRHRAAAGALARAGLLAGLASMVRSSG
jgi:hypothetical protein